MGPRRYRRGPSAGEVIGGLLAALVGFALYLIIVCAVVALVVWVVVSVLQGMGAI